MPLPEYKVVLMGGGGVGKSALTVRFVHQLFVDRYDPTIEDSYRRNLTVDGITVALEVLDTAGTEQFMSLSTLYMRSGDGFLLVFSLTSLDSLAELHPLRQQIQRIKDPGGGGGGGGSGGDVGDGFSSASSPRVPLVLVGNKHDLTAERQVSRDVAVGVSRSWGGVPYYETSARKEINVNAIFEDVVRQMIKADAAAGGRLGGGGGGGGSGYLSPRRRTNGPGGGGGLGENGGRGGSFGRNGGRKKCTLL